MANNNLFTFRCPADLREKIEAESSATGKDKTAVVVGMLRQSLPCLSLYDRNTLLEPELNDQPVEPPGTASQVISFRASGEFLAWLQSQVQEGESLNQRASRLLRQVMSQGEEVLFTPLPDLSTVSTKNINVEATNIPGLENLIVSIVEQRSELMADKVQQRIEALEQRLGEYERLKVDRDALRLAAESDDKEQVVAERDKLNERVSDLLLEVENLKNENTALRQAVTDANRTELQSFERLQESAAASESVQNHLPLQKIRERVLAKLKLGKQAPGYKAAVKAIDLFVVQLEKSGWQLGLMPETPTTQCGYPPETA